MRLAVFIICLLLVWPATADDKTELQSLRAALDALNQEQQTLYLQFQMLQELRRTNDRALHSAQLGQPQYATTVPDFGEIVQAQQNAARRAEMLSNQAERLYADFDRIGAIKAGLFERIQQLANRN